MARVLINFSEPGEALKRRALIGALKGRGHEVHLSTPLLDEDQRAELAGYGATAHSSPLQRTGRSMVQDIRYAAALWRLTGRLRPDLVVGFTIKPNIWGTLAASARGVPSAMVVTGLGYTFFQPAGWRHRLVGRLARFLYRRATNRARHVVFQNDDDRQEFLDSGCLGDGSKAFIVNGSGVDLDRFRPRPLPPQPVFLLLTRLLRGKGVADFADAASLVRAAAPDARFLLAGKFEEGPDAIAPDELAACTGGDVEYVGFAKDVRPLIEQASVVVLPSWREGTPRSVLEGMAMGRPVVTTDAPGCRQTVADGINGYLVPVRDPPALAAAMIALAADPALRRRMGEEGRRMAEARYSVERVNDAMMDRLGL